jgi:alginate O-acetyltransferase complex protein AlgI
MLFSSIVFLLYFLPAVLAGYYLLNFSRPLQNTWLLLVSLFFYSWGEPVYVLLMLFSVAVNYFVGIWIAASQDRGKKRLLALGVLLNLAILFYFKYLYFVVFNLDFDGRLTALLPQIVMPIGISFYTFQAVSYIADVYRERVTVQKNPIYLGMYIAFFPQLIAGPIVRYTDIAEQITARTITLHKFSIGFCRFVTGLGKKVLIANSMAAVADRIFQMAAAESIPAVLAWLGAFSYTMQIYYDFSAYSDMAIGLGLLFGFNLPENFNYPYTAKSVTEFWRRWHMTLGTWFRDYVYFPLGGSRVANLDLLVRNLFIVWLLTGVWHGAEWTFVMWGLFNFVLIAVERIFDLQEKLAKTWTGHLYLWFSLLISWVIFRADNLIAAGAYLADMFGRGGFWSDYAYMFVKENLLFYLLGGCFCLPLTRRFDFMLINGNYKWFGKALMICYPFLIFGVFLLSVTYLVKGAYNPFIYFRF